MVRGRRPCPLSPRMVPPSPGRLATRPARPPPPPPPPPPHPAASPTRGPSARSATRRSLRTESDTSVTTAAVGRVRGAVARSHCAPTRSVEWPYHKQGAQPEGGRGASKKKIRNGRVPLVSICRRPTLFRSFQLVFSVCVTCRIMRQK